jgi:hypothetical protein
VFDVDKWRAVLAQSRRRTPITAKSEVTFQQSGEGPWCEHKNAKSEAKAQEYLKDLRMASSFDAGHGTTGYGLKRNYNVRGREMPTVLSKVRCSRTGAGHGSRTRDLRLGKATLYQLS